MSNLLVSSMNLRLGGEPFVHNQYQAIINGAKVELRNPYSSVRKISLIKCQFSIPTETIIANYNSVIFWVRGSLPFSAVITPGYYTAQEMATHLTSIMTAADAGGVYTWNVGQHNKLEFVWNLAPQMRIEFSKTPALAKTLGFFPQDLIMLNILTPYPAFFSYDPTNGFNIIYLGIDEFDTEDSVNMNKESTDNIIAAMPVDSSGLLTKWGYKPNTTTNGNDPRPLESMKYTWVPENLVEVYFEESFNLKSVTPHFYINANGKLIDMPMFDHWTIHMKVDTSFGLKKRIVDRAVF